jgi:hypothetical protein
MWLSFGEALAAVAGALTGLLFVAVSVKSTVLAASRGLSYRAARGRGRAHLPAESRRWLVLADPRRCGEPVGGVVNAWLFLVKVTG